jgi:hypothetical protein
MKRFDLQSERYSPTGNVSSAGVLNQLGRPSLDRLTVLIREAVQNSWDARDPQGTSISFSIDGRMLDDAARRMLLTQVFYQTPANLPLRDALLKRDPLPILLLSDRGTTGLGGPTRADIPPAEDGSTDFVDFLRNVGQPPDKHLGGGTFGYGKAALYLASRVHTIGVYTRCRYKGCLESRFLAAALGESFEEGEGTHSARYTGRHWWGTTEDGIVEPVRDQTADRIAAAFNIPLFGYGECGTTIIIIDPLLDEDHPEQSIAAMAQILLWNFWPKMLNSRHAHPAINFSLSWEGSSIQIPDPRHFPPLHGFVAAMDHLKQRTSQSFFTDSKAIASSRPKQHLGMLSLHKFAYVDRPPLANVDMEPPVGQTSHHVALMRQAELVVQYMPGPPLPGGILEYAGVFIADEAVDDIFAKAEPPTHDAWNADFLEEPRHRTFIRTALKNIRNALVEYASPSIDPLHSTTPQAVSPLGAFASRLGGLLISHAIPATRTPHGNGVQPAILPADPTSTVVDSGSGDGKPGADENGFIPASGAVSAGAAAIVIDSLDEPAEYATAPSIDNSNAANRVRISIRMTPDYHLLMIENQRALLVTFELSITGTPTRILLQAHPAVVLDNGELEIEPPAGMVSPAVLAWIDPDGLSYPGDKQFMVNPVRTGRWQVAIALRDDALVNVSVTAREGTL